MIRKGITGAILAGGQSSRMGQMKALVPWQNRPMIQWVYDALEPISDEILISANTNDLSYLNATLIPDPWDGIGPIAGIAAVLSEARTDRVIIVSCDTPGVNTGLFTFLLEKHGNYEISLASHGGISEPMIGIFNQDLHQHFVKAIRDGRYKPPQAIRQRCWQAVDVSADLDFYHPDLFLNVNSPADMNKTTE